MKVDGMKIGGYLGAILGASIFGLRLIGRPSPGGPMNLVTSVTSFLYLFGGLAVGTLAGGLIQELASGLKRRFTARIRKINEQQKKDAK